MMTCKVVKPFKMKGAPVHTGAILKLTEEVATKLAGYIVPDSTMGCFPLSTGEAVKKIGAVAEELNSAGPWPPGLCAILAEVAPGALSRIKAANHAVDEAAESGNHDALDVALFEYKAAWRAGLSIVGPPVHHDIKGGTR
jgi:hypothetical protein